MSSIPSTSHNLIQRAARSSLDELLESATLSEDSLTSDLDVQLDDIDARRNQSSRKLASTLEAIYLKYEGNGDEEADDVFDLLSLEVVEDRGTTRQALGNRASHRVHPDNSTQTKAPVPAPSGKVASAQADSTVLSSDTLGGESTCEDGDEWIDADIESVSPPNSVISLQPSFKWPHKTTRSSLTPTRLSKVQPAPPLDSPPPSKLSDLSSNQDPDNSATNALYKRLVQRVKERKHELEELRMQKQTRQDSPGSEASSRVCPKDSTRASLCSSHTTASDRVTDSGSSASKYHSRPSTTLLRSETSPHVSLASSPITPRFIEPSPSSPCESSPLRSSALKLSSPNKRSRSEFEACLPFCRRQPASSKLRHQLGLRNSNAPITKPVASTSAVTPKAKLNTSSTTPNLSLSTNTSLPDRSRHQRSIVPRPIPRRGTLIDPRPILRRRSSSESSDDPLGLPMTPSKRAVAKQKATASSTLVHRSGASRPSVSSVSQFSTSATWRSGAAAASRPAVIEISSDEDESDGENQDDEKIELVKSSLDCFAFSSSPCRKRPRKLGQHEVAVS